MVEVAAWAAFAVALVLVARTVGQAARVRRQRRARVAVLQELRDRRVRVAIVSTLVPGREDEVFEADVTVGEVDDERPRVAIADGVVTDPRWQAFGDELAVRCEHGLPLDELHRLTADDGTDHVWRPAHAAPRRRRQPRR